MQFEVNTIITCSFANVRIAACCALPAAHKIALRPRYHAWRRIAIRMRGEIVCMKKTEVCKNRESPFD
jgi:hypothetical protein